METERLFIVAPAYNESENLEAFVNAWYPLTEKYGGEGSALLIVNDGSTDDTAERLAELAKDRPRLIPLGKENGGHGPALIYGYSYALEKGADWIFQTDSDGQTDPADFPKFWKRRKGYEALFAYRPERGDGSSRAFVEKVLCLVVFCFFGVKLPDANAPFRLMSREYLSTYLNKLPKDFNLPNVILTALGAHDRKSIRFLPISFGARKKGKNSINVKRIFAIGWKALSDFAKIRRDY
ncbi:MAG: glycosyltransferase family 2 protein [Lachnospiraceae bacterium]|nr:glycosyltransferase family 2 protein [Lachnospiraceae bacterium]